MKVETSYEQLFFTTVFINTHYSDGDIGSGTGFIYGVTVGSDQIMMFLITNKHVVAGAVNVQVTFIASVEPEMKTPLLGKVRKIAMPPDVFVGHPDPEIDVTAAPIGAWINSLQSTGDWVFSRALSPTIALTDSLAATLDALEEITFIGYPSGLYDKLNHLPIARRGITATPIAVDYEGKPVFLVDASVFPGSSGSPVFIAQTGGYSTRGGGFTVGARTILLGIIAAVYERQVPILQIPADTRSVVMDPLNIGIVYKAKTIEETVDVVLKRFDLKRYSVQPQPTVTTPTLSKDAAVDGSSLLHVATLGKRPSFCSLSPAASRARMAWLHDRRC